MPDRRTSMKEEQPEIDDNQDSEFQLPDRRTSMKERVISHF
ncbi:hypothetical protein QUF74_06905 [Candidatus Halobeggiatoa sp. HSG11]|nr:hypothetical protein [Candidatus Halobeggiatoa sp. HSG11]